MKVHFAGLESTDFAAVVLEGAGVRYSLFSVLAFIGNSMGVKAMRMSNHKVEVCKYLTDNSVHTIMDSGLFSLMFGAHAGERSEKFISEWQNKIVEFVIENKYIGTVVEVDCQKILGVDIAWKLRKRLRKQLQHNTLMNVCHIEDGKKGVDRMIEFSDYISISVPEYRAAGVKNLPEYIYRKASYIQSKKPSIKIHLLGCTQSSIMQKCKFCYSSDSTSWLAINRYGFGIYMNKHGEFMKANKIPIAINAEQFKPKLIEIFTKNNITPVGDNLNYYCNYLYNCFILKHIYEKKAGSQN